MSSHKLCQVLIQFLAFQNLTLLTNLNIFNPPPQHPIYSCEFCGGNAQNGHYCTPKAQFNNPEQEKRIEEEQAANARYWKIPACCDDDDDYDFAITPILSTEEPIDSLSEAMMREEFMSLQDAMALWMIGHSLRLDVLKCSQSYEYQAALGTAISMAIDKGIQEGLVAGIEHTKARRTLGEVEAYDLRIEARYVAAVKELKNVSLPLLDQLEALMDSPFKLLMVNNSISHEILLYNALAASHARAEKRRKDASLSLVVGEPSATGSLAPSVQAPFVNPVVVAVVSQESSLTVTDNQISSLTIVKEDVPITEAHDDMFDTTLLDRPEDHQPSGPSSS
nr:hypothetical protein [Tanacetum cinerariifolium]